MAGMKKRITRILFSLVLTLGLGLTLSAAAWAGGHIVYDAELSALSYVSLVLESERHQAGEVEALTAFYNYYDAVNPYHT